MKRYALVLLVFLSACVPSQEENFVGSTRSAVELRSMQSRTVDGQENLVARGVVATLHDLGYRITRVDAGSGTITATKNDRLRVAAVVRAQGQNRSVVRLNAAIAMPPNQVREVDAPEFYQSNFFGPLAAMMGRETFAVAADTEVPAPTRPLVERRPTTGRTQGESRP